MHTAFNFAAYQLAWFAVILGVAGGYAWAGAVVALLVAATHVALRRNVVELKIIGAAAAIGFLVDSTLAISGLVRFAQGWPDGLAPFWIVSLWVAFATTLNHSLRWLMRRPVGAALCGAIGAPLAYYAGAKLDALTIDTPSMTFPVISLLWSLAMIILSMLVLRASIAEPDRRVVT